MKKAISLSLLILVSLFVVTGCSIKVKLPSKENTTNKTTTTKKQETITNKVEIESVDLGSKYVDYNNRSFAINSKIYTLGKTTLKEMIDDGVPFDSNDIANADNNINGNYESQSFKINLGKYYTAQVRVINESKENMKISDCKLSYIYLPVNDSQEQNVLQFAFPLTMTQEELLANAGEPTDKSEYKGDNDYVSNKYEYKVKSTKYLGTSGYSFEFIRGKLKYIYITYKP